MLGHGVGVPLVWCRQVLMVMVGVSLEVVLQRARDIHLALRRDKDCWMMWFLEGKMMMAHRRSHRWCGFISRRAAAVS